MLTRPDIAKGIEAHREVNFVVAATTFFNNNAKYADIVLPVNTEWGREGVVGKCDACIDLREKGQNPACVDACLMRALEFGNLDELEAKHGTDLVDTLPILPPAEVTKPSVRIKAKGSSLDPNFRETEV